MSEFDFNAHVSVISESFRFLRAKHILVRRVSIAVYRLKYREEKNNLSDNNNVCTCNIKLYRVSHRVIAADSLPGMYV